MPRDHSLERALLSETWPISMLACGVADVCVRRNVWSVAYAVKHGSAKVIHGRAVRPGVCDGAEACLPRTVDLSAVCFRDVLEFRGSVRANGRALSGRAAWPHLHLGPFSRRVIAELNRRIIDADVAASV